MEENIKDSNLNKDITLDKQFIIEHISKLSKNALPLWGILTPHHMVEHLILAFRMAICEYKRPIVTPIEKLNRYQESLFEDRHLPKMYQNPYLKKGILEDLEFATLDEAKQELLKYYDKYESFFLNNPRIETAHVVFGMLDKIKWDLIQIKHMDHHFRQFNLKK